MTPIAITMMIGAMLIIWGGLIASILFLRSRPEVRDDHLGDPDLVRDEQERSDLARPAHDA